MKNFDKYSVYQIYPKSFKDSNGDGVGDLNGVVEKLDYLKVLGVDYIWLTPFYKSPQRDNGYDIADYYAIDESFGTMEDFERLIKECKARDINVMLDMVFNHTSTEHMWFKEAMKGNKKYKDYYIFRKGNGKCPPTNWQSKFGGSAWQYVEAFDEYYLHLFDSSQADLNWDNKDVREEVFKVVKFWLDKGVKGFRLDVINLISKPEKYIDDNDGDGRRFYTDGPNIHKYLKELNEKAFSMDPEIITVGEMSSTTLEHCVRYSNKKEKEIDMVFNFHHLKVDYKDGNKWSLMDFDFIKLKELFYKWQLGMAEGEGWNALFWCNHDQPRIVSRFGDVKRYHNESAKMLGTSQFFMRGTPYIFQGEEIGMTDADFRNIYDYRDVESINYFNISKEKNLNKEDTPKILNSKSRDNSRTPVQWNKDANGGFSSAKPWIKVNDNYKYINVEGQINDENSIFNYYKKMIKLRKTYDVIGDGNIEFYLKDHDKLLAYSRENHKEKLFVLCNFYKEGVEVNLSQLHFDFNNAKIILSNYNNEINNEKITLKPYECIVYYIEK